jgi:predicted RNA binding protein YcfA (HicA-like mRNA interferase family)
MNEMKKFNEAYNNIISEGFLRKVGQAFKSKKSRNKQLGNEIIKLFKANGFEMSDEGSEKIFKSPNKNITISFNAENFANEKIPSKALTIEYHGKKMIKVNQSDTLDEISNKINKILVKVGSANTLTNSIEKDSDMFADYNSDNKSSKTKTDVPETADNELEDDELED